MVVEPDSVIFWTVGVVAAFLVGMAKTGVPGLGILVVPLLAWIFPAKTSVGTLLPLLLLGDVAAVLLFRRHADWRVLRQLAPWTVAGMAAGAWALYQLEDELLRPLLGFLILLLVAIELGRKRLAWLNVPHQAWFTGGAGMLTGFATTIGNVAGPVMNIFLIGKGFDKKAFMGTVAWFFLLINASKVPLFVSLGMIRPDTLKFDLLVAPAALAGAFAGRRLLHALSDKAFHTLVLILAVAAGLRLLF